MSTKSKSKKVPAYIKKELSKWNLEHARRIKTAKEERLKRVLEKGSFETMLDVVEFELSLSSEQLKRLGSLYLLQLALGYRGKVTPQEVLEMARPVKRKKKPDPLLTAVVRSLEDTLKPVSNPEESSI